MRNQVVDAADIMSLKLETFIGDIVTNDPAKVGFFYIGSFTSSSPFTGQINEVVVYSRALSEDEVQRRPCTAPPRPRPTPPSPVAEI